MRPMMGFFEALKQLVLQLRPWIIVLPWEQALRVRLGKHVRELAPGWYFKIPIADTVFQQSIRLRTRNLGSQDLTTLDGKTLHLAGTLSYAIKDLHQLYNTMQHPDMTIGNRAMSHIAQYVHTHKFSECAPTVIATDVDRTLDLQQFGLGDVTITITDFVATRTYRLINTQRYAENGDTIIMDPIRG